MEGDWSIDAYIQFGESHVELPEAGSFFGNEVVSGDRLSVAGARTNENGVASAACDYWSVYSAHGALTGSQPEAYGCNATIVAANPNMGMSEPTSKPKTNVAPKNPSKTPIHCLIVTFSFNIGPPRALVRIG